jgi:hypothetical protein
MRSNRLNSLAFFVVPIAEQDNQPGQNGAVKMLYQA